MSEARGPSAGNPAGDRPRADDPPPGAPIRPLTPVAAGSPADPERGLRGVFSAILILEAITILLGITVIQHGGASAPRFEIAILAGLAGAHVATCALVRRRFALGLILTLQALLIACWAISGALGIIGIVFALVWVGVWYLRREFRRRMVAGTMHRG